VKAKAIPSIVAALVFTFNCNKEIPITPIINSVTATPNQIYPRRTTRLVCDADDEDGDVLAYYWAVWTTEAGEFSVDDSSSVIWTSPLDSRVYVIQVIVEDFATLSSGAYPSDYADNPAENLLGLLPGGAHPTNPFTGQPTFPDVSCSNIDPKDPAICTADLNKGVYQLGTDCSAVGIPDGQRYAIHGGNATVETVPDNLALILANY